MPRFEFSTARNNTFIIQGPIEKFETTPLHVWERTEKIKKIYINGDMLCSWSDTESWCLVYLTVFILRKGQLVPTSRKSIGKKRRIASESFIIPPASSMQDGSIWRGVNISKNVSFKKRKNGSMPYGKYKRGRIRGYYQLEKGDALYMGVTFLKNPITPNAMEEYKTLRSYLVKRNRNMHTVIIENKYYEGSTGSYFEANKMNSVDPGMEERLDIAREDTSYTLCKVAMSITRTSFK